MKEIEITEDCLVFIYSQGKMVAEKFQVTEKFFQLIEIIGEVQIAHTHFVRKIENSSFYELRIKSGCEYRVLMFPIDHSNFAESRKVICLNGFTKKSSSIKKLDTYYAKAIKDAEKILSEYLKK